MWGKTRQILQYCMLTSVWAYFLLCSSTARQFQRRTSYSLVRCTSVVDRQHRPRSRKTAQGNGPFVQGKNTDSDHPTQSQERLYLWGSLLRLPFSSAGFRISFEVWRNFAKEPSVDLTELYSKNHSYSSCLGSIVPPASQNRVIFRQICALKHHVG